MQKKSIFWLTLILSVFLPLVAACGSNTPTGTTKPTSTISSGENLYVLDGYTPLGSQSTGQHIVAFHPGSANPTTLVTLPAGLTSLDHQRIYIATPQHGQTTISIYNTQTGTTIRSFVISGTYSTAGQDYATSVISPDGRWLVLRQTEQTGDQTTIALIDTQAGKLARTISLNGDFDLDAVSPDGGSLYLLERLSDQSGHYYVRLYDVAESRLYENPIIDKTEINDPRMTGSALTRQIASDGTVAYTLYIDTPHNVAFVHILPMNGEGFPFARCVDLPVGKSADLLRYYTLALSSDGSILYAANGPLGAVSAISLGNASANDIWNDKIVATGHFNPSSGVVDKTRMLYKGAALSPDQQTLYFAGVDGIWAVKTADLRSGVTNLSDIDHYLTQQAFTGIGLSADGRTLYAVDPTKGITLLDAATGQPEQVIQGPAHTPWGIAWITD